MPIISADQAKIEYDVVIVGSGAGGRAVGLHAHARRPQVRHARSGPQLRPGDRDADVQHARPGAAAWANATPDKPFGFYDATVGGGWEVPGEPYTNTSANAARRFKWWRPRMLGGRTNHWGRISLRNGPYDFKPHSRDGLGFDWPISYEDVEPYYTKVEMLIGVYGTNEGLENTPDSPPGVLLPAPKGRAAELLAQKHGKKLGIPVISDPPRGADQAAGLARTSPPSCIPTTPTAQKIVAEAMREPPGLLLGDALRPRLLHRGELSVHHRPPAAGPGHAESRHHPQRPRPRSDRRQGRQGRRASSSSTRPPARKRA